jgi:hypothetical protein
MMTPDMQLLHYSGNLELIIAPQRPQLIQSTSLFFAKFSQKCTKKHFFIHFGTIKHFYLLPSTTKGTPIDFTISDPPSAIRF